MRVFLSFLNLGCRDRLMAEPVEFCVEVARLPPKDLPWTETQRVAVLPKESAHATSSSEAGAAGVQKGCRRGAEGVERA